MKESFFGRKKICRPHFKVYFAKNYCKDKTVLDIACGSGHGSAVLSSVAKKI
ncbi:MAG: hypothetical protein QXG86_02230 [Candidatus Woesearchaeota archaeon]